MNKKYICAIDPGVNGAIAIIESNGKFVSVQDMPTFKTGTKKQKEVDPIKLVEMFDESCVDIVILEKVHAMPQQGVTSTMNFGINFGVLKGAVGSLGLIPVLVTPQKWKKHFGLIKKPKDEARLLAQKRFPSASLERKKDVDRADALLMALWYTETYKP